LLIGEAMRGHAASAAASHAKRASIFAALDAEPTVFAPAAANSVGARIRSEIESSHDAMPVVQVANGDYIAARESAIRPVKARISRLNLAVAAVASVASVGAISWLGMQQLRQSQQPATIAASAQAPAATVSANVSSDPASQLVGLASVGNVAVQSQEQQLSHLGEYLAAHRQIANNSSIVPASRVVRPCTGVSC
jgi:trimeric autotransporter adhesin